MTNTFECNSDYGKCCIVQYASLFDRAEEHALSSSTQGPSSLNPMVSLDNSLAEMYRSPPRPLPYDADPRSFRFPRREKGSSHSHDENEPLRTSGVDEQSELLSGKNKRNEFASEEESKDHNSRLSFNLSNSKVATGYAHIYASSEEEDCCPTCLEGVHTISCHFFSCIYNKHLHLHKIFDQQNS